MTPSPETPDLLARRVLDRIDGEHMSPRPRWEFLFKNYMFWLLGTFAVGFGALAFSAALFEVQNVDWRLSGATHTSFISFLLAVGPFLWIFILLLSLFVVYANVRHTAHGYRYSLSLVTLGAVLTSITLGTGLYSVGVGGIVEEALGDHPPFYRPTLAAQRAWWSVPEDGLLSGRVVSVDPSYRSFVLRDFEGNTWEIDSTDLSSAHIATIARGGAVRIVGAPYEASSSPFHACFVFPWKTNGRIVSDPVPFPLASDDPEKRDTVLVEQSERCTSIRTYQSLHDIDDDVD